MGLAPNTPAASLGQAAAGREPEKLGLAGGLASNTRVTSLKQSLGPDSAKLILAGGLSSNPLAASLRQSPVAVSPPFPSSEAVSPFFFSSPKARPT